MPTYEFTCDACGAAREVLRPMSASRKRLKCRCGKFMRRDIAAEQCVVREDPEATQYDIDRYCLQSAAKQEVDRPVLAQNLAQVPGVRKIRGRDGKMYAFFRNRQDRRETLKRLGLAELD